MLKNKEDKNYTETVRTVYRLLVNSNHVLRITNIFDLLALSLGISSFDLIDMRMINNGSFESYLVDRQIDWCCGRDIDFDEIYKSILEVGEFTESEKILFSSGNLEERLWAIMLAVVDPSMKI